MSDEEAGGFGDASESEEETGFGGADEEDEVCFRDPSLFLLVDPPLPHYFIFSFLLPSFPFPPSTPNPLFTTLLPFSCVWCLVSTDIW